MNGSNYCCWLQRQCQFGSFCARQPRFVAAIAVPVERGRAVELATRTLRLTREVAALDAEAALACFRSSASALRTVSIEQFEEWVRNGLAQVGDARARRSYFAIETRTSYDTLHTGGQGLPLDAVQPLLRLYIEGLTGREVEIAPLAAVPVEARITDGRTIHLPSLVAEFGDDDLDFRLYKLLAAHAAGQIEFGTHEREQPHSVPLTRRSPRATPAISPTRAMPFRLRMT